MAASLYVGLNSSKCLRRQHDLFWIAKTRATGSEKRVPHVCPKCASGALSVHFKGRFTFQGFVLLLFFLSRLDKNRLAREVSAASPCVGPNSSKCLRLQHELCLDCENVRDRQRKTNRATSRGDRCPPEYRTPPPPKKTKLGTATSRQNIGFRST